VPAVSAYLRWQSAAFVRDRLAGQREVFAGAVKDDDQLFLFALIHVPGLGPVSIRRLVNRFGSAGEILDADEMELLSARLKPHQAFCVAALRGLMPHFQQHLLEIRSRGIRALAVGEADYPAALARMRDCPRLLFVQGDLSIRDSRAVAIVGTRRPNKEGRLLSSEAAAFLASRGVCVVSGLARGIDTCVHMGALEAGGPTLAVLGGGLRNIYPPENESLARKIAGSGALVCECCPMAEVSAAQLMARNRLVADLSDALVVIQARLRGGSFAAAKRAIANGKPVLVVKQKEREFALGAERLRSMSALLVTREGLFQTLEGLLSGKAERRAGQPKIRGLTDAA
jgi:DNA processing protein